MDQVKKLMAQLFKHGFWIGCGIIAIASVAIGVMSTLNVQDSAKKQKARIDSAISAITPVSAVQNHPNTKTAAARDNVNLELERAVYGLWKTNFDRQRSVLTWPVELDTKFHEEIKNPKYLQPELIPLTTPESELLSTNSANVYRNYIVEELPKLAPIIKAKWHVDLTTTTTAGAGGPGGMGGPPGGMKGGPPGGGVGGVGPGAGGPGGVGGIGDGGSSPGPGGGIGGGGSSQVYDPEEVVAWDTASQQTLAAKVLRGNSQGRPTTLDILYAQEDLWIVKALLNVIAKTNGNALERHRAPIKEIRTLLTGRDAGSKMGGIKVMFQMAAPAGGAAPADGAAPIVPGGPTSGAPAVGKPGAGGGGYGGGGAAAATVHPGDMRYVGADFQLKGVDAIKAAIESESFEDASLAVAKRVPFRMLLVMDQRELSKFLVNCGNNDLMVEVSQVRYNPQASSVASGSPMGMGGMGGMPGAPGAGGMPGAPAAGGMGGKGGGAGAGSAGIGEGSGGGPGGAGGTGTTVAIAGPVGLSPYDVLVDIYGYVQIYNIPATKKFKHLEQAAGATAVDGKPVDAAAATSTPATTSPAVNNGQPAAPAATDAPPAAGNLENGTATPANAGGAPAEGTPAPAGTPAPSPPPENGAPPANGTGGSPPATNP